MPTHHASIYETLETILLHGMERDEVLAHELVHLMRRAFEEPKYEEIFAYLTSKSPFRRLLGPLFRRPCEATLFLGSSLLPMLSFFLSLLPTAYCLFLLLRLLRARWTLRRCLKNLASLGVDPLPMALRLSDKEIDCFATLSREELQAAIEIEDSFRWRFLKATISGLDS